MAHRAGQQEKLKLASLVWNPPPLHVRAMTDRPRRVVGIVTWIRTGHHSNQGSIPGWHMVCRPTTSSGASILALGFTQTIRWVLYALSPGENRPGLTTTYSCLVPRINGALTSLPHTPSSYDELQGLCKQVVVA
jgi:hypothetical protein